MRVWDLHPSRLCRQHLLGQHREIHCMFTVIDEGRQGYSQHPETKRWVGKLPALKRVHDDTVAEMAKRGYNHASPLRDVKLGSSVQDTLITPIDEQIELLRNKGCDCMV